MIFPSWLLLTAFAAICCAVVNAKQANGQQYVLSAVKPTRAPLMTSTATPTKAPQVQITPTVKCSTVKDVSADNFPIKLPATVEHPLEAEESKPLAVTGFITKDGAIYELENGDSMGQIESRQTTDSEQHICNYGAVVVFSDVPCEEVTKMQVKAVEETLPADAIPAPLTLDNVPTESNKIEPIENNLNLPNQNEQKQPNNTASNRPNKPGQKLPNKPGQMRPNKPGQSQLNKPDQNRPNKHDKNCANKPNQSRPNKPIQSRPNKPAQTRPNKNGQNHSNKPNQNHPNRPAQNRPNKPNQNRPIQNGVNRPNILVLPNKNGQKRPSNNIQIESRRAQAINQRRWEEEEYDDDDEKYFSGYYRNNPALYFASDYDDY